MFVLYFVCAGAGAILLALLFLLGLSGVGDVLEIDGAEEALGDGATDAFQVLSVRSLLAGITFFGLGGALAHSAGADPYFSFIVAVAAGVAALLVVAWLMHLLMSLAQDGTLDTSSALGMHCVCYLAIPGAHAGAGKVSLALENRSVELAAMTGGEAIPTGAEVKIVSFIEPNTVEVAAVKREGA